VQRVLTRAATEPAVLLGWAIEVLGAGKGEVRR
jgi:hypothetical protein